MKFIAVLFALALMLPLGSSAQRSKFVRVYGENGHLLYRGTLIKADDSGIVIKTSKGSDTVSVNQIYTLKTAKTRLHNVAIGAGAGFIIGLINYGSENKGSFDVISGNPVAMPLSALGGSLYGLLSTVFKKSQTFYVQGKQDFWPPCREYLMNMGGNKPLRNKTK